jgi:hypothetical protein
MTSHFLRSTIRTVVTSSRVLMTSGMTKPMAPSVGQVEDRLEQPVQADVEHGEHAGDERQGPLRLDDDLLVAASRQPEDPVSTTNRTASLMSNVVTRSVWHVRVRSNRRRYAPLGARARGRAVDLGDLE